MDGADYLGKLAWDVSVQVSCLHYEEQAKSGLDKGASTHFHAIGRQLVRDYLCLMPLAGDQQGRPEWLGVRLRLQCPGSDRVWDTRLCPGGIPAEDVWPER